jgi:hypothetical protein
MSRAERTGPGLPTEHLTRHEAKIIPPELVIAATTSEKRLSFLVHVFGEEIVRSLNGGIENQRLDSTEIVAAKIEHARALAGELRKKPLSQLLPRERIFKTTLLKATVVVAADVVNETSVTDHDGRNAIDSQNKPIDLVEVREMFRNTDDVYNIAATSEVRPAIGHRDAITVYCPIKLRTAARLELATARGSRKYLKELGQHFKSTTYLAPGSGVVHCPDATHIAGARDVGGLARRDAIEEVNCIPRDIPQNLTLDEQEAHRKRFEAALEDALYMAHVGIDRNALRPYAPDIDKKIHSWPWLQGIMAYALGQTV